METTFEIVGLVFQILGVLIVLFSQIWFAYRARKKCGGLEKAFLAMVAIVRVIGDEVVDEGKLTKLIGICAMLLQTKVYLFWQRPSVPT